MKFSTKKLYVRTDGWRGYEKPTYAVFGANDTGSSDDSPCPSFQRKAELAIACKIMKQAGFNMRQCVTKSSNVFCVHFYLIASIEQFEEAKKFARSVYDARLEAETDLLYYVN